MFHSAAKAITTDDEDATQPRRRQKEGTATGGFQIAARNIMRRIGRLPPHILAKMSEAFGTAKAAITAPVDGWLAEFIDSEPAPLNVLDPASPHFHLGLGTADQSSDSGVVYDDGAGASLEL